MPVVIARLLLGRRWRLMGAGRFRWDEWGGDGGDEEVGGGERVDGCMYVCVEAIAGDTRRAWRSRHEMR